MFTATYKNSTTAFEDLYDLIMQQGTLTKVGTKAIYNVCISILNPTDRIITTSWRKFSTSYAEREWNWYLSGNPSVEEIKKYAKTWDKMHYGDNIVNSNYGYQWMRNQQLQKCIEQLRQNPNTRQAWISIFDGKEKNLYKYDTPCTMAVGFDIRDNKLCMNVLMRSNDLIYGFCNDTYCFSRLQELVAQQLGLEVGEYCHFAHDLHIYEKHFDMKAKWLDALSKTIIY